MNDGNVIKQENNLELIDRKQTVYVSQKIISTCCCEFSERKQICDHS